LVIAATRAPSATAVTSFSDADFEFSGFDVVDTARRISVILNCGGFPEVFSVSELSSESGLLTSYERAFEIRDTLRRLNPDGEHSDYDVWAIWSSIQTA
jgi:hypothetical protein